MSGPRGLRRQILVSFVGFAAAMSVLFALSSFVVAYVVEDAIFEDGLQEEVARQQEHRRTSGGFTAPARDYVAVHASPATFPADLRRAFTSDNPQEEYAGEEGRHYHVLPFPGGAEGPAYLIAEVSGRLAVRSLRGEILVLLGAMATVFLAAAAALGYWLSDRTLAPLGRLVDSVSAISPGEVPQVSAADFPRNEVGALAGALESLLERAKGFVEREIRFTRDASHELRTPLAIVRSSAELIEARRPLPSAVLKPLRRIIDAARNMERTIDLLLLLAREERSRSAPCSAPLLPLVEKVVLEESERFRAGHFEVSVDVPGGLETSLDPSVARMVLGNLVGNVFKHAPRGLLRIWVENHDLIVGDAGEGLPTDVLALLNDAGTSSEATRSGLGLSIVARLCRLHDVAVSAVSSRERGTQIRLGLIGQKAMRLEEC